MADDQSKEAVQGIPNTKLEPFKIYKYPVNKQIVAKAIKIEILGNCGSKAHDG